MSETAENDGAAMVVDGKTYSVKEVAELAGVTQHGVRAAMHAGRLRRCNGKREKPRFSQAEVELYIAARESGKSRGDLESDARTEIELAKADALTNLVSQAQGHTEQMTGRMLGMADHLIKGNRNQVEGYEKEIARLTARCEDLESKLIDGLDFIRGKLESDYQDRVRALDEEGQRKKLDALIRTVTPFAGAALARIIGGEAAQQEGMIAFVKSLTDEQRGAMMQAIGPILNQDQVGTLMLLLSKWEARESKEQATAAAAEPKKEEATPDPPGAAS